MGQKRLASQVQLASGSQATADITAAELLFGLGPQEE
jgi:hypothetical protein